MVLAGFLPAVWRASGRGGRAQGIGAGNEADSGAFCRHLTGASRVQAEFFPTFANRPDLRQEAILVARIHITTLQRGFVSTGGGRWG